MFDTKKEIQTLLLADQETFYRLVETIYERMLKEKQVLPEWISEKEALDILGIRSKTTLSKYRNSGYISFSKMNKIILYKRSSLYEFIESKSHEKF